MRRRFLWFPALVVAVLLLNPGPVPGQSRVPRTPWGHPDLQGTWDTHAITPLERPDAFAGREFLTDEEAAALEREALTNATDEARQEGQRDVGAAYNDFWWDRATTVSGTKRTSLVVDPKDGRIPPLTAEAQRRSAEEASYRPLRGTGGFQAGQGGDHWTDRSLWERCITQGLPRITSGAYNSNVRILQTPGHVVIHYEMIHEDRIVPLDGRAPLPSTVHQWMGDARGRWEGDTLVVETANFSDATNFRGSTSGLRMTERFTRLEDDTLQYQVTFSDPSTWTRPWTAETHWRASAGAIYEYACHEGNYGMTGILAGGRAEDREASAGNTGSR